MKKTRGRKPKAANTVAANPNQRDQEHRESTPMLPPVPQTTSNLYSPALQYFFTVQNNHLTRLRYLFPEINPAALKKILDLCEGDFIRTVDKILCMRRHDIIYGSYGNNPSADSFGNRRATPLPNISTHTSSNNKSMTMVEPPVKIPRVQTSHKMPYINQTMPSNYHINQYPGINNNSMLMQTPVFVQGSTVSAPTQFIQNCNNFSEPVPCPALPKRRRNISPVQTTSTYQPSTEQLNPMLLAPSPYSDMPLPLLYEINDNVSNVHGQYLMKSPQMVRPNLMPTIQQENDYSNLTAYNISERPRNSTNQVTHRTMPEIFVKQQKESWFQQQQQQCDENQILELLNNIQPLITHQSHQDVDEASVPLLPLTSCHDRVTTPIQTVSTTADIQRHAGKFEDEHSKSYATNEGEVMPDVEVTQKLVTEEMQMFRATSDANLKKFTAKGSVKLQEENERCHFTRRNRSDYLDETSRSEDSCLVIDTDAELRNIGSDNGQGHYVESVMAEAQSP